MRIPHYLPAWNTGRQIINLGQGGPASHMDILSAQPRSYPTQYRVGLMGMVAMPRHVMGPTEPVTVNAYSNPLTINNLQINGLMKSPVGG